MAELLDQLLGTPAGAPAAQADAPDLEIVAPPSAIGGSLLDRLSTPPDPAPALKNARTVNNPDEVAKQRQMAAQAGLPLEAVQSSPEQVGDYLFNQQANKVLQGAPSTSRWISDKTNAGESIDSIDALSKIEAVWDAHVTAAGVAKDMVAELGGNAIRWSRSFAGGVLRLNDAVLGATAALGENINAVNPLVAAWDMVDPGFADRSAANEARLNENARLASNALINLVIGDNSNRSQFEQSALQGVQSAGTSLAAMATMNPAAALAVMSGTVFGQEYGQARDAGLSPLRALLYGSGQASIEAITEKIPLFRLFEGIKGKSSFAKLLGEQMVAENVGEQIATIGQDYLQWITLNPEKTLQEFIAERPDRAVETAIATTTGTLLQTGVSRVTSDIVRKDVARADAGMTNFETMVAAREAILASPLTARDAEKAAEHFAGVVASKGAEAVYISADTLAEVAGGTDPVVYAQSLGIDPRAMQQALALGGEVRLTPEQFAAFMVGNEFDKLSEHIRLGDDAMTMTEAKEYEASGIVDEVQSVMLGEAMATSTRELSDPELLSADQQLLEAGWTPEEIAQMTPEEVSSLTTPGKAPTPIEVASDSVVVIAEQEMGLQGLFMSAAEAGMTPKEYEAYLVKVGKAALNSRKRVVRKLLKEQERRNTAAFKDARDEIHRAVEQQVLQRPEYQSWDEIGVDRINREAMLSLFPETMVYNKETGTNTMVSPEQQLELLGLSELKKDGRKIVLPKGVKGGLDPSALAERHGFDSATHMLMAWSTMTDAKQTIEVETDLEMERQNPSILSEQAAIAAALQELHKDDTADVLAAELNALRQAKKEGRTKPALVRKAVQELMKGIPIEDAKPSNFLAQERKYARLAAKELRAGDREAAARAKWFQLVSHVAYTEAFKAQDKVNTQRKKLQKVEKKGDRWKNVDAHHLEKAREMTADVQLTLGKKSAATKPLSQWLMDRIEKGDVFSEATHRAAALPKIHYSKLTLGQWDDLYDGVQNILQQGRELKKIWRQGRQVERDFVKGELIAQASELPTLGRQDRLSKRQDPSLRDRAAEALSDFDASLRKVENMLQRLDGGDVNGPWHKAIFNEIARAEQREHDLQHKVLTPVLQRLNDLPRKIRRQYKKQVTMPSGIKMTRANMLMMMLHTGNTSSMDKLMRGRPDLTEADIEFARSEMTPQEADFVQFMWDQAEKLWPDLADVHATEFGEPPSRVENLPSTIGGKQVTGGYFPAVYDKRRETKAHQEIEATGLNSMQTPEVQAVVFNGMTKSRTSYAGPLSLDLGDMTRGLQQTIHFITHYRTVRDVQWLLRDEEVRVTVRDKLGPEYLKQMENWLDNIAKAGMHKSFEGAYGKAFQIMRRNVTVAILGLSYTTLVAQTFGYSNSIARLGKDPNGEGFSSLSGGGWLLQGLGQYLTNPRRTARNVFELSGEMRHRLKSVTQDVAQGMQSLEGKSGIWAMQQRIGLLTVSGMQMFTVDIPTWVAAYNKGVYKGMSTEDAIEYADTIIRTSQGSGNLKDLSRVQSAQMGKMWQMATMMSSYALTLYNQQMDIASAARKGGGRNAVAVAAQYLWVAAIPALLDAAFRGEGPGDDEDEALWVAKEMVGYSAMSVPVIGRGIDSMIHGFEPTTLTIDSLGRDVSRLANRVGKAVDKGDPEALLDEKTAEMMVRAFGMITGMSGTQTVARALDASAADSDSWYDYLIGHKD